MYLYYQNESSEAIWTAKSAIVSIVTSHHLLQQIQILNSNYFLSYDN